MKTNFIFPIAIVAMLIVGCTPVIDNPKQLIVNNPNMMIINGQYSDTVLVLSIPDWVIGKALDSLSQVNQNLDSLKALRKYDNKLFKALLKDSTVRYVYTRKFNPCCPCSDGASCCKCTSVTTFASPSVMNATVKINDPQQTSLTKDTKFGIDFFTIPSNVSDVGLTLTIDGDGIEAPLEFSMDN